MPSKVKTIVGWTSRCWCITLENLTIAGVARKEESVNPVLWVDVESINRYFSYTLNNIFTFDLLLWVVSLVCDCLLAAANNSEFLQRSLYSILWVKYNVLVGK